MSGNEHLAFEGANWEAYSEVEFRWLEILLDKGGLLREDLIKLLDAHSISFQAPNWRETLETKELGNVLLNDVPREALLPEVQRLLEEQHPERLNLEEAQRFLESLINLDRKVLEKLLLALSQNANLRDLILSGKSESYLNKEQLCLLLLEAAYQ